jgi:hypothetical protein
MEALKNLPIGVQDFESLRNDGYLYVDKTALVYQLVTTGRYYFLSRPRRFGKSMLLSTLHAYFSGKKELFEGLAIEKLEKNWTKYPVLHLDLNLIRKPHLRCALRELFSELANRQGSALWCLWMNMTNLFSKQLIMRLCKSAFALL